MDAAQKIRSAVGEVERLRFVADASPGLRLAVMAVKHFQSVRFAGTYQDLLAVGEHKSAARFFLNELYSDKDYSERDAQFARIAGAMQRFFPPQVVGTAVALAELHALTESLDHAMGEAWFQKGSQRDMEPIDYVEAWRDVGRKDQRASQLSAVMRIGDEMVRLTRTPGLRLLLKMMRAPASAAGLNSLQTFLEAGFDTFAEMARRRNNAELFLRTIRARESDFISMMFECDLVASETKLRQVLGTCPITK